MAAQKVEYTLSPLPRGPPPEPGFIEKEAEGEEGGVTCLPLGAVATQCLQQDWVAPRPVRVQMLRFSRDRGCCLSFASRSAVFVLSDSRAHVFYLWVPSLGVYSRTCGCVKK